MIEKRARRRKKRKKRGNVQFRECVPRPGSVRVWGTIREEFCWHGVKILRPLALNEARTCTVSDHLHIACKSDADRMAAGTM